jgi:uncharacterized membrane protein YdbT with pleckstrin-like domain
MGYVDDTLGPGERVLDRAEFHWLYTVQALLALAFFLAIAAGVYVSGRAFAALPEVAAPDGIVVAAAALLAAAIALVGLFLFLRTMLHKWTTEIAVTDRRLVYKSGFIARRTQELPVSKLEEVNLNQSILGRLFGYGRLAISGTGGDAALVLPEIDDPIAFRRAIAEARGDTSAAED